MMAIYIIQTAACRTVNQRLVVIPSSGPTKKTATTPTTTITTAALTTANSLDVGTLMCGSKKAGRNNAMTATRISLTTASKTVSCKSAETGMCMQRMKSVMIKIPMSLMTAVITARRHSVATTKFGIKEKE